MNNEINTCLKTVALSLNFPCFFLGYYPKPERKTTTKKKSLIQFFRKYNNAKIPKHKINLHAVKNSKNRAGT